MTEETSAQRRDTRNRAFGEGYSPTVVDRFGIWLSASRIRRSVPTFRGLRLADVGCGYHAAFSRTLIDDLAELILLDLHIEPSLRSRPKVRAIEGSLPESLGQLGDGAADVVVCNSVLEHLWDPVRALSEMRRIIATGGVLLVNVPSWRGKRFLELSAFRLGLSPADEMNDHKAYYDPSDLWPLLVRAGFAPDHIRCFRHKFGLNTFATCRK
ncbi:MAG: class I SAM-dependent methyltransferase [Candidatus Dormibacteraeota bacterium]|nr:class I SAM-dependent methyltransferase [Candidatus Dormibacteraeota bacterium]